MSTGESDPSRDPLDRLAESFLERYRRGERPSLAEYAEAHPDLADDIRELFAALVEMEVLKPDGLDPDRSPGPRLVGLHKLGDYRLLGVIGRGGMGVVYEAVQESLGRRVALKVLLPEFLSSPTALKRFRLESRSAAALHHTNIVPVFGVGEQDGYHYYAMQLIRGQTLEAVLADIRKLKRPQGAPSEVPDVVETCSIPPTETIARKLLTAQIDAERRDSGERRVEDVSTLECRDTADLTVYPGSSSIDSAPARDPKRHSSSESLSGQTGTGYHRSAAKVALQVAEALAYAHDQGVLHRDIKPSNILLDLHGAAWVADFGLAKLAEGEALSRSHDVVGTLRYMAPERFDGWSDPRSDVYGLGVTLYEMLTLRPAFDASDQAGLIRQVVQGNPSPPHRLDPEIPRDLDTIVLKAMARESAERYATASVLAEDLRRFIADRTILARRSTPRERLWRWCRRNRAVATLLASVLALMLFIAVYSTVAAVRFKQQSTRANLAEGNARARLFDSYVAQARASRYGHRLGQRFGTLRALADAAKIRWSPQLRDEAIAALALPDLEEVRRLDTPFPGMQIAFNPVMDQYATLEFDGSLKVRRVADGSLLRVHPPTRWDDSRVTINDAGILGFSADGRYLAVQDQPKGRKSLSVYRMDVESPVLIIPQPVYGFSARFAPTGGLIAIGLEDGHLLVRDLDRRKLEWQISAGGPIHDAQFSPDGRRLAVVVASKTPRLLILAASNGEIQKVIPISELVNISWSVDGTTVAVAEESRRIHFFDAVSGRETGVIVDERAYGTRLAYQPSGRLLASWDWTGAIRLWRPDTLDLAVSFPGQEVLGFSSDGSRIALMTPDRKPAIYRIDHGGDFRTLVREPKRRRENTGNLAMHPNGRLLAATASDGLVFWDIDRDMALASIPIGLSTSLAFDASGTLWTNGPAGLLRWPVGRVEDNDPAIRIGPPEHVRNVEMAGAVAVDAASQRVLITYHDGAMVINPADPSRDVRLARHRDTRYAAVTPDGRWAATGTHSTREGMKIWSLLDGRMVKHVPADTGLISVKVSGDGRWLAQNESLKLRCHLWSVGDWREVSQLDGLALAFSSQSQMLALALADGSVRLADPATGKTIATLEPPGSARAVVAVFTPDGSRLVVLNGIAGVVQVWDLSAIQRRLGPLGLAGNQALAPASTAKRDQPLRLVIDRGGRDFSALRLTDGNEIERLTACLEVDPNDFDALMRRGVVLASDARSDEAAADYARAIAVRPNSPFPRHHLINLERERGNFQAVAAHMESLLMAENESAATHNDLAWLYATGPEAVRSLEKALPHVRRAIALDPKTPSFHNTYGVTLYRLGLYREAIGELMTSLRSAPASDGAYDLFFLTMCYHRLGDRRRSLLCFERALRSQCEARRSAADTAELNRFRAEAENLILVPTTSEDPEY